MVEYCWANVNKNNFKSQSNGSLMRSTPISVYGHLLPLNELRSIIKQDNNFTHCHANVVDSVFLYSVAIGSLIRNGDTPDRALTAFNDAKNAGSECTPDVQQWLDLSKSFADLKYWDLHKLDPASNIGFLKHAFVASFYFLQ